MLRELQSILPLDARVAGAALHNSRIHDVERLDTTATVTCGWLDPRTGECSLANAGHVPPLLVQRGVPRFVSIGGTLLGFPLRTGTSREFVMNPGDRIVLYTDGLVERRRECAFAELRPGNVGDDVAIMAIRRLE
ncbi:MAG: SpoIIE family protein phosphatase [Candidatus Eremiobacteraeota bacterium]|nr:SpoIIE family protein phosphatase [Candidatus Eremiobacteraeota bacterium]